MRKKVLKFLQLVCTLTLGLAAFALRVSAMAGGEYASSVVPDDLCGWVVGLAIGFLLIGSLVVLIVVHKKRDK